MANCTVQTDNSSGVNVRSAKAVSSSNLLGVIDDGTTVNVVRCDGTWATFMYQGSPAFVQHQFLVNPPSKNGDGLDTGSNNKAVCNASNVNIRNAATFIWLYASYMRMRSFASNSRGLLGTPMAFREGLTARQMVLSVLLSSATSRLVVSGSNPRATHSTLA